MNSISIHSPSLEDVFIYLTGSKLDSGTCGRSKTGCTGETAMIRGAVAIFRRDFKKFLSNPFMVVMTLVMPIMYLVIFGNAMGGTISHIPVAVVQDGPPYNDTPLFTNAAFALNHINQKDYPKLLDITEYTDEVAAKQALGKGLVSAVIVFPAEGSSNREIRLYVDSSDYDHAGAHRVCTERRSRTVSRRTTRL